MRLQLSPGGALGGALGGLLGFALGEAFAGLTLVWSAAVGLALGAALTATENRLGLRGRLTRDLPRSAVNGALVGAISGVLGQYLYLAGGGSSVARALGWACLGAGVGLALGFADKSLPKSLRGAAGGAVGGFVGGLIFNTVFSLFSRGEDTGTLPRALGLVLLGAAVGLTVRLAQELFKRAWLMGLSTGPYEGREYILAKPTVTVGRSDGNDVSLYRETALPLRAGVLRSERGGWVWEGEAVPVNGSPSARQRLEAGDTVRFGNTEFLFQTRGNEAGAAQPSDEQPAPTAPTAPILWALEGPQDRLELPQGPAFLGRSAGNALVVADPTVSGSHASLEAGEDIVLVSDLGSTNGTFVNGVRLEQGVPTLAKAGDRLRFGSREYRLVGGPS